MRNTYLKNLYTLDKYKKILLATLVAFPVWEGNILWLQTNMKHYGQR